MNSSKPRPSRARFAASTAAAAAATATYAPSMVAAPVIVTPASPPTVSRPTFGTGQGTAPIDLNGDLTPDFKLRLNRSGYLVIPAPPGTGTSNTSFGVTTARIRGTAFLSPQPGNAVLGIAPDYAVRNGAGVSFKVGGPFQLTKSRLRYGYAGTYSGAVTSTHSSGQWPGGANFGDSVGYAGVQFLVGGNTHYGWIKLSVKNDQYGVPIGLQALQWAYESQPGVDLHVTSLTAVPEVPATAAGLGALALGAVGVQALRRQRRTQTPSAD